MLFVPPSIPYMVPEAEAADYVKDIRYGGNADDPWRSELTINVGDSVTLVYQSGGYSHYRFDAQWMNHNCGPVEGVTCIGSTGYDVIPSYTHTFDQVGTYQYDISHMDAGADFLGVVNVVESGATPTVDTTPPVITVLADQTYTTNNATEIGMGGRIFGWDWQVTATDDSWTGVQPVLCSPQSGSFFTFGTTTVTCTKSDQYGNVATASFDVTVTYTEPTNNTILTDKESYYHYETITITGYSDAATFGIQLTKPDGSNIVSSSSESNASYQKQIDLTQYLGAVQQPGNYIINLCSPVCHASDRIVLNSKTISIVINDTTPPVLSLYNQSNSTANPTGISNFNYHLPIATDDFWENLVVACTPPPGSTFPVGTTTVTCTATDAAGNVGTGSFTVTVILEDAADTTYPAETAAIIGNVNYLAQTNQQPHQFSGNTAKIYVVFNENVPTMGSLVNIIAVFPNAQSGVSLNSVNVPYALTHPGGTEEGVLTSINTNNLYDMVLSINSAPVAGHYIFQTDLISTSFDVYGPDTTPPVITDPGPPYTITDDATGGDCQWIGTWNSGSKTCTLTTGFKSESTGIIIGSNGITLDGGMSCYAGVCTTSNAIQGPRMTGETNCGFPGQYSVGVPYVHAPGNHLYGNNVQSVYLGAPWPCLNISSSAPGDSYGIDTRFRTDVTIKDVLVAGFGVGIRAGNTVDSEIIGSYSFWNSLDGIYSESDSGLTIGKNGWLDGNHAHSNLRNGITISGGTGNGECSGTGSFVIEGLSSRDNAGNGLEMFGGDQKICVNQSIEILNNGDSGVYLGNSQNNIFDAGFIANNLNYGFFADSSSTIESLDADIYDNGNDISTPFTVVCESGPGGVPTPTGGGYACTFPVEVESDTTPPVITVLADQTYTTNNATEIGMGGRIFGWDYWQVTATDDSWTGVSYVLCSPQSGSFFTFGTTTVTCTKSDAAGNVGTASFTITVSLEAADTTPPVITVPSALTFVANNATEIGMGGASYNYGIERDNLTGNYVLQESSGGVYNYGSVTATDDSGEISMTTYDGVNRFVSCNPQPGSFFSFGTTTVTCTATDAAGNVGTASFTVTIVLESTSIIVTNALGSSTPGCEPNCFLPSTASIPVGGTIIWENSDNTPHTATSGTAGGGPSGHFDSSLIMAGGSYSHTFDQDGTYHYFCMVHPWMEGSVVVGDGTPVRTADPESEPEPELPEVDVPEPTDEHATVTNAPGSSTPGCENTNSCFLPFVTEITVGGTVTWYNEDNAAHTATSGTAGGGPSGHFDSSLIMAGGSYSHTFFSTGTYNYFCMVHPWMLGSVVVEESEPEVEPEEEVEPEVDTTPPILVVSNNISTQTYDPAGKIVSYATPSAVDVGGIVGLSCNYPSGVLFSVGTTTVTCTAVDASGNVTVKRFTITIVYDNTPDTTLPVFVPVSDVQLSTTNPDGITYNYAIPQVSDNIGVTIGPTCTPESGSTFPIGIANVICTASDAAGNQQSTFFSVTVVNPNATGDIPTFAPVENITEEANVPNGKQLVFPIPTATDDETELPLVFCTPSPGYLFPVGVTTITCIAIDEDGNQGAVTFTVTITPQTQQQTSNETADLSITTVESVTLAGDSVSSVSAGGLAYFTTSLVTESTGNAFITVYVQDAGSTALGVGHFKSVIVVGDSDLTLGFRMPSNAISGIANVYVNVWTDETMTVPITDEVNANVEIIGMDPTDLGAFNYSIEGFPSEIGGAVDGYSPGEILDTAISYWKDPDSIDTYAAFNRWSEDCPHCMGYDVNSYADSKVPFGDDFVTDLSFNQVDWNVANLQILWIKEYGFGVAGEAPISAHRDVEIDVIYVSLGSSENEYGTWQQYSAEYLAFIVAHEMGHVIGFAHDGDPESLMYSPDAGTGATSQNLEYGTVELTKQTTGGDSLSIPTFTSRDVTNFNYHVSTDNEAGFNVYFAPDLETADAQWQSNQQIDSYPGCFVEDVMSTGTLSCNNVEMGSGLFITIPLTSATEQTLTDITVKLQENFGGMQSLSNVATTQEAPIITTAVQSTKFELLVISDVESEHESVFMDGTDYLVVTDTTLTQDIDKFSITGWIKPDFSKSIQDLTIVSKYHSFDLYLQKEFLQVQGANSVVIKPRTLVFTIYDGAVWHTIPGHTEITEDWHHVAAIVDGSVATLYLDGKLEGKMKLEKKVPVNFSSEAGICQQKECIIDVKMLTSDSAIGIGAYIVEQTIANQYCDYKHCHPPTAEPEDIEIVIDNFTGIISSVEIFSDAFTKRQIFGLYEQDKNYYQKSNAIDSVAIGSESPALSDSECLDLAKERGLEGQLQGTHTLVCQFPFNVIIPLNSSILWMETLPLDGGPYHIMVSVDDLFRTEFAPFALMDFYEPDFTYGLYEYLDVLNESLTGKIIIAKQLEIKSKLSTIPTESKTLDSIKISGNSAAPACAITNSCYEPFVVSVDVGAEVIWKNTDRYSHTITSGTPEDGPDGLFDSGILPNYKYFSYTFYEAGVYDYYCTIHPWMQGMIVVGEI